MSRVTEVRMSPDLRHAVCFVSPWAACTPTAVVEALNRHAKFLRGRLGRTIDMKFTPDLQLHPRRELRRGRAHADALFRPIPRGRSRARQPGRLSESEED